MKLLKFNYLLIGLASIDVLAQTTPPPPGGAPGGFPLPGIVYALMAAVSYGIYKHVKNPKK